MSLLIVVASMLAAQAPGAPAPAPSAEEAKASEKVICKREVVTGSLAQRKRTCMTQREWERLRATTRDNLNDYIDRAVSNPAVEPG